MATRNDPAGGSPLWRGIQHLIFGEDSEPTLREEIEEAIDEAEESEGSPPTPGDLSPVERQMLRNLLHFGEETAGGRVAWLADGRGGGGARGWLQQLAEAVGPRQSSDGDDVHTLGGLMFLLVGRIPAKGECVDHPAGCKLEAIDSDPGRISRV